jgi:molybdate transport system permease protein
LSTPSLSSIVIATVAVGTAATAIVLSPGVALAYALARRRFFGRRVVEALLVLPLTIPPVATGFALLLLLGRRGPIGSLLERALGIRIAFTWGAAVIAAAVMAFPLLVLAARQAFEEVDPRLEALSRTLGRGPWRTFFTVSVPLASRGIVYGGVLGFARAIGEFGATSMLAGFSPSGGETLSLGIFSAVMSGDNRRALWLTAVSVAISLGAIFAGQSILWRNRRETRP